MSKNYFILHGHFYQPPRENPWSGYVDRQVSAYPENDWNTRIHNECYSACTRTPVLDNDKVLKIINCYEYLSFNFGPTLLSWMDKYYPETIEKIIQADRISMSLNNGHGNAIAQVYNHMIMPLSNMNDQYTQILWGLYDFKKRFGRDSEGIWLAETAINNETAAILADCGIKFIILSPFQVKQVTQNGNWIDVSGGHVDTSKPYRLTTRNGDLSIFFYDGFIASAVSFGNQLTDAHIFYNTIKNAFATQKSDTRLVNVATDGEVYGHHKHYGNMALARLIYDVSINNSQEFSITNYASFLSEHPASEECILELGKDNKGSSWSCAHGVGRWYEDCGCHTGGDSQWNQKWRTPLRNSFDFLRDELHAAAEDNTKELIHDIWSARNDYITLFMDKTEKEYQSFFEKHQKKDLSQEQKDSVIKILEALRYSMLMYTSCGWFFSDISGIETVQDMLYASFVVEHASHILSPDTIEHMYDILSQAYSNLPEHLTGKNIWITEVEKAKLPIDVLKEYFCWLVLKGDNINHFSSDVFTGSVVYENKERHRHIIHVYNFSGLNAYTAFYFENDQIGDNVYISYKNIIIDNTDFSIDEFWKEDASWSRSYLSSLPNSLKLQLMSHSIHDKLMKGYRDHKSFSILIFSVLNGIEYLLLPNEKEIVGFYHILNIHSFVSELFNKNVTDMSLKSFLQEVNLLHMCTNCKEKMVIFLEPVVFALEKFVEFSLKNKNEVMLKQARIISWGLKEYMSEIQKNKFRDIIYIIYTNKNFVSDTPFYTEIKNFMKEFDFSRNFIG